jgi:hypothetical protein
MAWASVVVEDEERSLTQGSHELRRRLRPSSRGITGGYFWSMGSLSSSICVFCRLGEPSGLSSIFLLDYGRRRPYHLLTRTPATDLVCRLHVLYFRGLMLPFRSVLSIIHYTFTGNRAMSKELQNLIEKARRVQMSSEEKEAQRISFAYGNTRLKNENMTREAVERASQQLKDRTNDTCQHSDH